MKAPGRKEKPCLQIWQSSEDLLSRSGGENSAVPFDRRPLNLLPDNEPVHL